MASRKKVLTKIKNAVKMVMKYAVSLENLYVVFTIFVASLLPSVVHIYLHAVKKQRNMFFQLYPQEPAFIVKP